MLKSPENDDSPLFNPDDDSGACAVPGEAARPFAGMRLVAGAAGAGTTAEGACAAGPAGAAGANPEPGAVNAGGAAIPVCAKPTDTAARKKKTKPTAKGKFWKKN
ncbi:MAG: hypothetical protein WA705_03695, partial [Candidatus Ozemobacteraceae bacterium]